MEEDLKDKEHELSVDEQAMLQMLIEANALERGGVSDVLTIDGKKWKMRQTSMRQNKIMLNHDVDIMHWQNEQKQKDCSKRKYKALNAKIRKAYAKKAAHRVLGKRLWLIPFMFMLTWRKLYNDSEQVVATINAQNAMGENQSFYLANLGSSKRALVLSTMQVGNAVKQLQERKASATSMLDEDALPKKEEDSK